jgi:putative endonuclease
VVRGQHSADEAFFMFSKIKLGKFGEQIAANYLQNKGYQILETNYYTRDGEIDLICQKDKILIFVEVKTRTNRAFGWPEEAVTDDKVEKLANTASHYLQEKEIDPEWQIDIISIVINKKAKSAGLKHFQNIGE